MAPMSASPTAASADCARRKRPVLFWQGYLQSQPVFGLKRVVQPVFMHVFITGFINTVRAKLKNRKLNGIIIYSAIVCEKWGEVMERLISAF
ncbi:MAG: hypothetical protein RR394_10280, partial [Oscillospiraceae bacterium]